MEKFDLNKFYNEFNGGDLWGLEYLERTLIAKMREKTFCSPDITKEDYLINLFYAVKKLNYCNQVYEDTDIENNFNWDVYANVRDLLFKELGIEV